MADKRLNDLCPTLEENFLKVLHDHTAGDPMRADVEWTNLSRPEIAKRLTAMGTPVSRNIVSSLLRKHGYRRRKAQKKKTMRPPQSHPQRPVRELRPSQELSFTHISLLTEVLTVINLAAIFHNTVHLFKLSNELNENTITV